VVVAPSEEKLANAGMLEEMTARLYEVLELSGYVHTENVIEKLRRLVRRMHLREHDAVMWLGILRQMLWRLKREDGKYDASGTAVRSDEDAG
jgi:tRNA/rRNA methyltransferase